MFWPDPVPAPTVSPPTLIEIGAAFDYSGVEPKEWCRAGGFVRF